MTEVEKLAAFVVGARYQAISEPARQQLKIRVLDSLGCAIGALDAAPIASVRAQLDEFGGNFLSTLIGGGKSASDRAAFYEIHAQSAIDGALELRRRHDLRAEAVAKVEIDIFDVAHRIIGGGEEGDKTRVETKEQADHSLPYMIAVALCDGELLPAQYAPRRILAQDVQRLLRRVTIGSDACFTERFPEEMPCLVAITLQDGRRFEIEKRDYEGFHTRPMSWEGVAAKFHRLAAPFLPADIEREIIGAVERLERINVRDLTRLLAWDAHNNPEI